MGSAGVSWDFVSLMNFVVTELSASVGDAGTCFEVLYLTRIASFLMDLGEGPLDQFSTVRRGS